MSANGLLRRLGVGRLALHLYHRPIERFRRCLREGGPWQQRRTAQGCRAMMAAARQLPALTHGFGKPVVVHLLSGTRFWYQSAFCLHSLATQSGRPIHPVIYDDGTLHGNERAALMRLFPVSRFVDQSAAIAALDAHLPRSRYPFLRARWQHYPNIRKLIDPHVASSGWKLVLDSDLLFFSRPELLLEWHDNPTQPLHAVDCETSYGYSRPLLDSLAGAPLAELVNVGLCGFNSAELDWDRVEQWCRALIEREGTHYYLEQALFAMLVAGRTCTVAPAHDYVTRPVPPEALACRAVMHHYVAESKRWYFQHNWRRAYAPPRALPTHAG